MTFPAQEMSWQRKRNFLIAKFITHDLFYRSQHVFFGMGMGKGIMYKVWSLMDHLRFDKKAVFIAEAHGNNHNEINDHPNASSSKGNEHQYPCAYFAHIKAMNAKSS